MSTIKVLVPANDSLRVRYSVRLEDGSLLPLTNYDVTLTVKASNTQAAPVVTSAVGVVQTPDTEALAIIAPNILDTPGLYWATIRAFDNDESYSDTFQVQVTDHA